MSRSLLLLLFIVGLASSAQANCVDALVDMKASEWRNPTPEELAKGNQRTHPAIESMLEPHSGAPNRITIHYTGVNKSSKHNLRVKMRGARKFAVEDTTSFKPDLWGDLAYHYYIDINGEMAEGRDIKYRPNTNTYSKADKKVKYDTNGHIAVVIEGTEGDDLSEAQRAKLFATIKALQHQHGIPTSHVDVHKHFAHTKCPGETITKAVEEYKRAESKMVPDPKLCTADLPGLAPPTRRENQK